MIMEITRTNNYLFNTNNNSKQDIDSKICTFVIINNNLIMTDLIMMSHQSLLVAIIWACIINNNIKTVEHSILLKELNTDHKFKAIDMRIRKTNKKESMITIWRKLSNKMTIYTLSQKMERINHSINTSSYQYRIVDYKLKKIPSKI